jgi:hypothetical protein
LFNEVCIELVGVHDPNEGGMLVESVAICCGIFLIPSFEVFSLLFVRGRIEIISHCEELYVTVYYCHFFWAGVLDAVPRQRGPALAGRGNNLGVA